VIDPPNGLILGETNQSLTISNASQGNIGNYFVLVSNVAGSVTSSVVSLTLTYLPSIVVNPIGFIQSYHGSNNMFVVASGTPPLSYQWQINNTNIIGATNSSYIISSLGTNNVGSYRVKVINPYGFAYSGSADVNMAPSLLAPFSGAVGLWGQSVGLVVGAIGSGNLDYQWYFNGVTIAGATSSNYALNNIQFTNAGLYSVVVSSAYGSVTNMSYQLVVNPANISIGTCPIIYINGTVGYNYTIQSSTNLADVNSWTTITNVTLDAATTIWADRFTDTTLISNQKKFYRVVAGQ
jgi:hypothetical protein